MKIATIASLWFAASFATAIASAPTAVICIVPAHAQNAGWTDLDTDYLLVGPDLMRVPYVPGVLKT